MDLTESQQQISSSVDRATFRTVKLVTVALVMLQMCFLLVGFNLEFEAVYKMFGIVLSNMHLMLIITLIFVTLLLIIILSVLQVYLIIQEETCCVFLFMLLQIGAVIFQVFAYIPQLTQTPHHVALHVVVLLLNVILYGLYSTYLWMLVNKKNGLAALVPVDESHPLVRGPVSFVRHKNRYTSDYHVCRV